MIWGRGRGKEIEDKEGFQMKKYKRERKGARI
jgi:hypothetical protein